MNHNKSILSQLESEWHKKIAHLMDIQEKRLLAGKKDVLVLDVEADETIMKQRKIIQSKL